MEILNKTAKTLCGGVLSRCLIISDEKSKLLEKNQTLYTILKLIRQRDKHTKTIDIESFSCLILVLFCLIVSLYSNVIEYNNHHIIGGK